jgi:signal transduction histidine kinase
MASWWGAQGRRLIGDHRVIDGTLVLACLGLTVLAVHGRWSVLPPGVIAVAGVLGSLAQWPRRSRPGLAAVAGAAATALSGNPGPVLVGLYAGSAHAPRRHVWAYPVVAWVGLAAYSLSEDDGLGLADAVGWALLVSLVTAIGAYLAARATLLESLRDRAARAESERRLRDEQARAAERTRIAREMHDVLAHKVSLIAVHAGALELQTVGDDRLRRSAGLIRLTAREALQELRVVLGVLHADGSDLPGAPVIDLDALVRASVRAGQRVDLRDTAGPLPPALARVVNRVVQEGLTNVRKHAPGAETTVSVGRDARAVSVIIRNDLSNGPPMDLPGSGSGLVGLAERVRLVGGTLHSGPIETGDRLGWELRAMVPWLEQLPLEEMPEGADVL